MRIFPRLYWSPKETGPVENVSAEELSQLDQSLRNIENPEAKPAEAESPQKPPQPAPKMPDEKTWEEEHLRLPDEPKAKEEVAKEEVVEAKPDPLPAEEPPKLDADLQLLKDRGFDIEKFKNMGDVFDALQGYQTNEQTLRKMLTDQGHEVPESTLAQLVTNMQRDEAQKKLGFPAQPVAKYEAREEKREEKKEAAEVRPSGPGQATNDFLNQYRDLNWNGDFISRLAGAVQEHLVLPKHEAVSIEGLAQQEQVNGMFNLARDMFVNSVVTDHIAELAATGQTVPTGYRQQLFDQIDRNPDLVERAFYSFASSGRYNGVMGEYAKGLPALPAEQKALADEAKRVTVANAALAGSTPPAKPGTKTVPTIRELEEELNSFDNLI